MTRVGVQSSALGGGSGSTGSVGSSGGASAACQTRNFIAQFQMVAAFDAAPVASEAAPAEAAPAPASEPPTSTEAAE